MKSKLLRLVACYAAGLALAAQAQNPQDTTAPGSTSATRSQLDSSADQTGANSLSSRLSATGRMGHHELRASKLMGAEVKTSSGESLGRIEDVIVNPASGRIDFAVISYSTSGDNSAAGLSGSSTASTTATTSSNSGEKLVPLPWTMIRASGAGATTSSGEQPAFVFNGDKSRLQGAPSFDRNSWPDVSQSDWNQRITTYFGAQGSATGGATSPGGVSTGESSTGDNGTGTSNSQSTPPESTPGTPK